MDLIGLEPIAGNPENKADSAIDPSAVVTPVVTFETDCPDLVALAELWERLPPAMRGAVLAGTGEDAARARLVADGHDGLVRRAARAAVDRRTTYEEAARAVAGLVDLA